MASLADEIERHLKRLLTGADEGIIEIRRCDLADLFRCVPSQINYVLETRFTPDRGFYVESRRGGGGFIRIAHVSWRDEGDVGGLLRRIGKRIGAHEATKLLQLMVDMGAINRRQYAAVAAVVNQETDAAEPRMRDAVRAVALRSCIRMLLGR